MEYTEIPVEVESIADEGVFKESDLSRDIISGLSEPDNEMLIDKNICKLTDHTWIEFVARSEIEEHLDFTKNNQSTDEESGIQTFFVPENITVMETLSLIEQLYSERSFEGFAVREVLSDRLFGTQSHLNAIIETALQVIPEENHTLLNPIVDIKDGIGKLIQKIAPEETPEGDESIITLSQEEVQERVEKVKSILESEDGINKIQRYVSMLSKNAFRGVRDEVVGILEGEIGMALYSRGSKYLLENLPVQEYFEGLNTDDSQRDSIFKKLKKGIENALFLTKDLSEESHATLVEKLRERVEKVKEVDSEEEQSRFIYAIMEEVVKYPGWVSSYKNTIQGTSPSMVVETGEMGCTARCAMQYGLLRTAGWKDNDLYSVISGGHASLIVRTQESLYMLENFPESGEATFQVLRLENIEEIEEILSAVGERKKKNTTYSELTKSTDMGRFNTRDSTIHQGSRGFGILFLLHLATIYGENGREDLKKQVLSSILKVEPDNKLVSKIMRYL